MGQFIWIIDWLSGPSLFSWDGFPAPLSFSNFEVMWGLNVLDKLSVAEGRKKFRLLPAIQLIGLKEVNYTESKAVYGGCHRDLLSTRATKSDHSLKNLLWPPGLGAIINSVLAGCPEDMKTFSKNIWLSLTQEREGRKKITSPGTEFHFLFMLPCGWRNSLVFEQMCVEGEG